MSWWIIKKWMEDGLSTPEPTSLQQQTTTTINAMFVRPQFVRNIPSYTRSYRLHNFVCHAARLLLHEAQLLWHRCVLILHLKRFSKSERESEWWSVIISIELFATVWRMECMHGSTGHQHKRALFEVLDPPHNLRVAVPCRLHPTNSLIYTESRHGATPAK